MEYEVREQCTLVRGSEPGIDPTTVNSCYQPAAQLNAVKLGAG